MQMAALVSFVDDEQEALHSLVASVVYSANHWVQSSRNHSAYQLTFKFGATAILSFEGDRVALLGDRNNDHGNFQITVDDEPPATFSSYFPTLQPIDVLYSRALEPGRHTLKVTNAEEGKALGLSSFACVYQV